MVESKACQDLVNKVIKKDLCTLCGACVGMCPYLVTHMGRVVLKDVCDLTQGRCSAYCPRMSLDLDITSRATFGIPYTWDALGITKGIFMARSTDAKVRQRVQDAGTITTLIRFALSEGFIDSAVLTRFKDKSLPKGVIVSTKEEVLACAGSSYMAAPTLEAFNREAQNVSRKKIGIVGTPCQVLGLARMKESELEGRNNLDKLKLVIGLFCTWALSYPDFAQFLEKEMTGPVLKYDIPPHPANVLHTFTEKGQIDIPLDRITPFIKPACQLCHDLTAEFADISVGSGRGKVREWNTVILRTERGMEIFDAAQSKGVIEITEIPERNLNRLKEASRNKKKRALKNIIQKTGSTDNFLYLKVQPGTVNHLLENGG
ncbi:MAG: Coenzyme F420 hydrogenase/dehydrogenase, beta subunit C-terminal domain [Thermodesulfobacteriota bacterium]